MEELVHHTEEKADVSGAVLSGRV